MSLRRFFLQLLRWIEQSWSTCITVIYVFCPEAIRRDTSVSLSTIQRGIHLITYQKCHIHVPLLSVLSIQASIKHRTTFIQRHGNYVDNILPYRAHVCTVCIIITACQSVVLLNWTISNHFMWKMRGFLQLSMIHVCTSGWDGQGTTSTLMTIYKICSCHQLYISLSQSIDQSIQNHYARLNVKVFMKKINCQSYIVY